MKIYFGFTVAGDRGTAEVARAMVRAMEEGGHEVLTKHLVEENAADSDRRMAAEAVFERDMRWLKECDVFVAEVSGSSFGIGYEAAYAMTGLGKRAVLFYRRELEGRISLLISGNRHPLCRLLAYERVEEALEGLRAALAEPPSTES